MKDTIQTLVEIAAPSGYESPVRQKIQELVQPLVDETRVDALGNLLAVRRNPGKAKMMIVAHMDEIGLMATHIDSNGFVRFIPLGGVYPMHCVGGRVRFLNGVQGVIGSEVSRSWYDVPPLEKMFVDVGAVNRDECPVKIGDVAAFERPFLDLGKRMVSKAMDDRVGVAVLIETLRRLKDSVFEVYAVFSVQEEVGLRGATTAAFGVEPDIGIAIDVTDTGDTPNGNKMVVGLGKGPAIKIRDSALLCDPRLIRWMVKTAEAAGIPYQREILTAGGTDAGAVQLSRSGVPSGAISIPCRYIHAPSEMVDYDDVENAVQLLKKLMETPLSLEM